MGLPGAAGVEEEWTAEYVLVAVDAVRERGERERGGRERVREEERGGEGGRGRGGGREEGGRLTISSLKCNTKYTWS